MKTAIAKAIIAFLIAGIVPVVLFFIGGVLFLYGGMSLPNLLKGSRDFFGKVSFLAFFCVIFPLTISFAHLFFLGIPAFIVGWRFRVIHWWSVLVASFFIGAIPTGIFVLVRDFELPSGFELATGIDILAVGFVILFFVIGIMGLFGASGGLAFWLVWRYWAFPESPAGRPLSLEAKEQSTWSLDEKSA